MHSKNVVYVFFKYVPMVMCHTTAYIRFIVIVMSVLLYATMTRTILKSMDMKLINSSFANPKRTAGGKRVAPEV